MEFWEFLDENPYVTIALTVASVAMVFAAAIRMAVPRPTHCRDRACTLVHGVHSALGRSPLAAQTFYAGLALAVERAQAQMDRGKQ